MDKISYKKISCEFCGKMISTGGAAYTSHMRAHVKKQEAVEYMKGNKLAFYKPGVDFAEKEPYARLGNDPLPGQPKEAWNITEDIKSLTAVTPAEYFITSGEAVKKAEKLVQDAYSLAVKSRSLLKKLIKARGLKKYLETSRDRGMLITKAKNPRNKDKDKGEEDDAS